jgi:transcriptional regulator with XRE-family HTH domain
MTINDKIAIKIAKIREEKGLMQKDLAALLDMNKNTYHDIESGKTKLSVELLFKIAEILKVSISEILEQDNSNTQNIYENKNSVISVSQNHNGDLHIHLPKELFSKIE